MYETLLLTLAAAIPCVSAPALVAFPQSMVFIEPCCGVASLMQRTDIPYRLLLLALPWATPSDSDAIVRLMGPPLTIEFAHQKPTIPIMLKLKSNVPSIFRRPPGKPEKPLSLVASVLGLFQYCVPVDFIFPPATEELPR